jgi:hypothetical protein
MVLYVVLANEYISRYSVWNQNASTKHVSANRATNGAKQRRIYEETRETSFQIMLIRIQIDF